MLLFSVLKFLRHQRNFCHKKIDTENSDYSVFLLCFVYSGVKFECFALPQIFLVPHIPKWSQVHVFHLASLSLQLISSHSLSTLSAAPPCWPLQHACFLLSCCFCCSQIGQLLFASLETIYRKIHAILTRCQKLCQSIGQVKIEYLIAEVCLCMFVEIFF